MNVYEAPRPLLLAIRNAKKHVDDLQALKATLSGYAHSKVIDACIKAEQVYEELLQTIDDLETPCGWEVATFYNANGEFDRVTGGDGEKVHSLYCEYMLQSVLTVDQLDWYIKFTLEVIEKGYNRKDHSKTNVKLAS